jgi:hypothetical protein
MNSGTVEAGHPLLDKVYRWLTTVDHDFVSPQLLAGYSRCMEPDRVSEVYRAPSNQLAQL